MGIVNTVLDFENRNRAINLAPSVANGQPVVHEQLQAAIEGMAWKDSVRTASTVNVTVASPGSTIDGIAMAANDRTLLKNQTAQTENGLYIWNGPATPMTRALDGSTFAELESAVVNVEEGTNAGTQWRQTQVNGVIGINNVIWTPFGTSAPAATETTAGVLEIASQPEMDTGTDDTRAATPAKVKNASWLVRKYSTTIGDASATSIAVTHNLGTEDVIAYIREATGSKRMVLAEIQHTSINVTTFVFDQAPALNGYRVTVLA